MLNSLRKNKKGILLMLLSSVCVCIGQLLWKISSDKKILLFVGFLFYGIGALIMITAYHYGELSILQPMLSMNYVLSIILARVVLKEEVTISKLIGIIIIMVGIVFIAGGGDE